VKEALNFARIPIVLVLDSIRSLYNIGSIFRTADALLIEKIYLCGICGQPPDSRIDKVALGAVDTVPFEYIEDVDTCLQHLKKEGREVVAPELTKQSENYREKKYKFPMALVLGNEIEGIGDSAMKLCDSAVDIPMGGRANSLNVATAIAVVGYEAQAQYINLSN
jgi:tRNA G18 (ribose-2'-O)-methylase SpoU